MSKLLILQGIPASGKSTFAREWVAEDSENRIIVNRDSIRDIIGEYWVPSREPLITEIEDFIIVEALYKNYDVCVDATNLNPKTIKRLKAHADLCEADIEFKKFDISLEEAIERDYNRDNSVGIEVIKSFYYRYCTKELSNES